MQVQVRTDDHIPGREDMEREIEQQLRGALERHADRLTRVEVHLSDVNAASLGEADKRCLIEARAGGHEPVAVSHQAGDMRAAVNGAADKLLRALDGTLGKTRDHRGRETIRRGGAQGL